MAAVPPHTNPEALLEAVICSQKELTAEEADLILRGPQSPIALLTPVKAQSSSSSSASVPVITVPDTPTVIRRAWREATVDEIPKMDAPPQVVEISDDDDTRDTRNGPGKEVTTVHNHKRAKRSEEKPYMEASIKFVKADGTVMTRTESIMHAEQCVNLEEYLVQQIKHLPPKMTALDLASAVICVRMPRKFKE